MTNRRLAARRRRLHPSARAERASLASMAAATALAIAAFAVLAWAEDRAAQPPVIDRGEVGCSTDSECEALDHDTVLIGIGCGPEKVTTFALYEDEFFSECEVIEPRRVIGSWNAEG